MPAYSVAALVGKSDIDALKAEIEHTRAELAETVKQVVGPYRVQIAAGAAGGLVLLLVVSLVRRRSAS